MDKNVKLYKSNKIQKKLKNSKLIFFFHTTNLKSTHRIETEQKNLKKNIKLYKIHNNSFKTVAKKSVFVKFCNLVKGSLSFAFYNNPKIVNNSFKEVQTLNTTTSLTALKLNKKIYSIAQLNKLVTLNYTKNVIVLNRTFKKLLKKPYHVLKN